MITLVAKSDRREGGQYIARIVGRHPSWTFEREFVGRKMGVRDERTEADLDTVGLYEIADVDRLGKKQRYVFILNVGCDLKVFDCEKRMAMAVARTLDEGHAFSQIVRSSGVGFEVLTPTQVRIEAKRADVARSLQAAFDECWKILQAIPTREARRVLANLKKRLKGVTSEQPEDCGRISDPG